VPCSLRTQTCTCKRCQYRRRIHVVDSCHRKHVETDCSHDSRVLSTSLTSSSAVTTRPQRYHIIIMPPLRRGAGALSGDRRPSSVCLSVCLSDVAYIGYNSKTKRPRKTKLCTGVPQVTCDSHTDFKVKTSKVKVTGRGILWRPPSRTACYTSSVAAGRVRPTRYLPPVCNCDL